ncbi:MAG: hypothetical protein MHM6MM_008523 [Cercozoa sp. M6MM]
MFLSTIVRAFLLWFTKFETIDSAVDYITVVHMLWSSIDGILLDALLFVVWLHYRNILSREVAAAIKRAEASVLSYIRNDKQRRAVLKRAPSVTSNLELLKGKPERESDESSTSHSTCTVPAVDSNTSPEPIQRSRTQSHSRGSPSSVHTARLSFFSRAKQRMGLMIRQRSLHVATEQQRNCMRVTTLHSLRQARNSIRLITVASFFMFSSVVGVHVLLLIRSRGLRTERLQTAVTHGWISMIYMTTVGFSALALGWDRRGSSSADRKQLARAKSPTQRNAAPTVLKAAAEQATVRSYIYASAPKQHLQRLQLQEAKAQVVVDIDVAINSMAAEECLHDFNGVESDETLRLIGLATLVRGQLGYDRADESAEFFDDDCKTLTEDELELRMTCDSTALTRTRTLNTTCTPESSDPSRSGCDCSRTCDLS